MHHPVAIPPSPKPERDGDDLSCRFVFDGSIGENPTVEMPAEAPASGDGVRASANAYGVFSLETFATASGLNYTHEDAGGFYNYVANFDQPNFWYRDSNVQVWAYYEPDDNYQDTYGTDAVNVVYHSGHGGRTREGKVQFPLGANYLNQGSDAWSDKMCVANERVNYLFWSTCLACPVYSPITPVKAWGAANKGFRMLFGFETTSWDSPYYGQFFFEEFNKGKSFTDAWLDASWRIAHDQQPAVVACGATPEEATDRVYNERAFFWDHVSSRWWRWRWCYASRLAPANMTTRQRIITAPGDISVAQLRPIDVNAEVLRSSVDRLGLRLQIPREVIVSRTGAFRIGEGHSRLAFGADGSIDSQLAAPNYTNRNQIPVDQAAAIAQDALGSYGLARESQLVFDQVRFSAEAGGTGEGSGELLGPFVTETTIVFKQLINGLPVITPGVGEVRISVDNDGTVTNLANSTRAVDRLTRGAYPTPGPDGKEMSLTTSAEDGGVEQRLGKAWAQQLARWVIKGQMPVGYTVVPESTEVGYAIQENQAVVVAARDIEVDFGNGLFKRYRIEAPLA